MNSRIPYSPRAAAGLVPGARASGWIADGESRMVTKVWKGDLAFPESHFVDAILKKAINRTLPGCVRALKGRWRKDFSPGILKHAYSLLCPSLLFTVAAVRIL